MFLSIPQVGHWWWLFIMNYRHLYSSLCTVTMFFFLVLPLGSELVSDNLDTRSVLFMFIITFCVTSTDFLPKFCTIKATMSVLSAVRLKYHAMSVRPLWDKVNSRDFLNSSSSSWLKSFRVSKIQNGEQLPLLPPEIINTFYETNI